MTIQEVWTRLASVRTSTVVADGVSTPRRVGTGSVEVARPTPTTIEWIEAGTWQGEDERPISYRNALRWSWDRSTSAITLHQIRRGTDQPVHLADLAIVGPGLMAPTRPHQCADDRYLGTLHVRGGAVALRWRVTGPRKSYCLTARYTC